MSTFCISTRKESKEIHPSNFGGSGEGVVEWKQLCARLQRKLPTGQLEREPERHRLAYQLWHGSVAPEAEKKTWFIIRTQFAIIGLGGRSFARHHAQTHPFGQYAVEHSHWIIPAMQIVFVAVS